ISVQTVWMRQRCSSGMAWSQAATVALSRSGRMARTCRRALAVLAVSTATKSRWPFVRAISSMPSSVNGSSACQSIADETFIRKTPKKLPLGGYGGPEEVATLFAFWASDEASFITGEWVIVAGGELPEE